MLKSPLLHIKAFVTISVNFALLLLILILTNCKSSDPHFKIYGNQNLLNNSIINLTSTDEANNIEQNSLLYKGKVKDVAATTAVAAMYELYISFEDSLIYILKIENIMKNTDDHINHLYIEKKRG